MAVAGIGAGFNGGPHIGAPSSVARMIDYTA
jgi:hypothetical protein